MQLFRKKIEDLVQIGSTGSRLLTGNLSACEKLEKEIASFHGEEAGLLFSSGYSANLGLLTSVLDRDDRVFYDAKVHASIREGIALSRARAQAFRHHDLEHLHACLKSSPKPPFVVIESLYSTDGTLAPIDEIFSFCEANGAHLIVDEAHATGVFGPGLVQKPVFARVHTFGKALGVQGAIVLGKEELRSHLITTSRPFIYTTAPSLPFLAAIECAYTLLKQTKHALLPLCKEAGLQSPILAIPSKQSQQIAIEARQAGFDLRALVYPTVARGEECLRICLHTFNTKEEIDHLYAWLHHCRK